MNVLLLLPALPTMSGLSNKKGYTCQSNHNDSAKRKVSSKCQNCDQQLSNITVAIYP